MKKFTRIVCLILCILMLVPMAAACSKDSSYGAHINMYLADEVYNFDPIYANKDKSAAKIISLLFEGLVTLDEKGKLKKQLLDKYTYTEDDGVLKDDPSDDTFKMIIHIKPSTWSDKTPVSANDFAYAWRRILDPEVDCDVASMLYDIKNAKAHKTTGISVDDVGIEPDKDRLTLTFERSIDPEEFLYKIANVAFVPLRNFSYPDWASTGTTFETNGPFTLRDYYPGVGMTLSRNAFYRRDILNEDHEPSPTKFVTPYCIKVDFQLNSEDIMQKYEDGELFYISELPMDKETKERYKEKAKILDTLTTHSYMFNLNKAPFNNKTVRQVLSKVIDRAAIAEELVFAYASTGIIPNGVNDKTDEDDFAQNNTNKIGEAYDISEAIAELRSAGISPASFGTLEIAVKVDSVASMNEGDLILSANEYDLDVTDYVVATMVAEKWNELGFNFKVVPVSVETYRAEFGISQYRDKHNELIYGIKEPIQTYKKDGKTPDIILDAEPTQFDVIAIDDVMQTADAFYTLAAFARNYSGSRYNFQEDKAYGHISGFVSDAYDAIIDAAYDAKIKGDKELLSAKLHEAESMLLDEAPVIPIFVYQEAVLIHKNLSKVKFDYFGNPIFSKVKLKNWKDFLPAEDLEQEEDDED